MSLEPEEHAERVEKLEQRLAAFEMLLSNALLSSSCAARDLANLERRLSYYEFWRCPMPPEQKAALIRERGRAKRHASARSFSLRTKGEPQISALIELIREVREECASLCEEAAIEQEGGLKSLQEPMFTPGVCRRLAELIRERGRGDE